MKPYRSVRHIFAVVGSCAIVAAAAGNPAYAASRPGAPTAVSAVAGNASATVSWKAPTSTGGAAITGYTVTSSPGAKTCSTTYNGTTKSTPVTCVVSGLTNGGAYTFTVKAKNWAGFGDASKASSAVKPMTTPSAPTNVQVVTDDKSATLTWAPPVSNGGSPVLGYVVALQEIGSKTSAGGCTIGNQSPLSCLVTGLTAGKDYQATVAAKNAAGQGLPFVKEFRVIKMPGAPLNVTAFATVDNKVEVQWDPPTNAADTQIDWYQVTSSSGNEFCVTEDATHTACSVEGDGLVEGNKYTFTVSAVIQSDFDDEPVLGPPSKPVGPIIIGSPPSQALRALRVVSGGSHSCAITVDKTVTCWGLNTSGQLGVPSKSVYASPVPVEVPGLTDVDSVVVNDYATCAVKGDGTVWCWGVISGLLASQSTPTEINNLDNVSELALGGKHLCALLLDSKVKCLGSNTFGQLGNGQKDSSATPVTVTMVGTPTPEVLSITAGYDHTCAIVKVIDNYDEEFGQVQCWGRNTNGQLGTGNVTSLNKPQIINANIKDALIVDAGPSHTCASDANGAVLCWGSGTSGENGNPNKATNLLPTPVKGITDVSDISAGAYHTCATKDDGTVWCWGSNQLGQFGNGKVETGGATPRQAKNVLSATTISAGGNHTCAIVGAGLVSCWGRTWVKPKPDADGWWEAKPVPTLVFNAT